MGELERIDALIKKAGNAASFAQAIGTTESSVSKLRHGVFKLHSFAERIARAFPEVNCRWLLTGEGEPFVEEPKKSEIAVRLETLEKMVGDIKKKR